MNRLAIVVVLVAGSLVACSKKKSDPAPVPVPVPVAAPDAAPTSELVWTITATPSTVTMEPLAEPMFAIRVVNNTKDVLDASKIPLGFMVNGKESPAMGLMFGKGGFGPEWSAIKPGAYGHMHRKGRQGFAPGTYEVVLHSGDKELARTSFTVTE